MAVAAIKAFMPFVIQKSAESWLTLWTTRGEAKGLRGCKLVLFDPCQLRIESLDLHQASKPAFTHVADEVEGLEKRIEESKEMLSWGEDWDGEGSPAFKESTFQRATDFLRKYLRTLQSRGVRIELPRILPGPGGGIDLHWKQPRYELLINIPAEETQPATFYGDDYGSTHVKGSFETDSEDYARWAMFIHR